MAEDAESPDCRARAVDRLIGRRIARARRAAGIEVRDLARVLGVTAEMMAQFEAGARRIGPVCLVRAARHLQVSLAYLFYDGRAVRSAPVRERRSRR